MPDSWIDKKELDELVGSLPVSRKKRRRPSSFSRQQAETLTPVESAGDAGDSGASLDQPAVPESEERENAPIGPGGPGDSPEELAVAFEIDDEGGGEEETAGEEFPVGHAPDADAVTDRNEEAKAEEGEFPAPRIDEGELPRPEEASAPIPSSELLPFSEAPAEDPALPEIILGADDETRAGREVPDFLEDQAEWLPPRPVSLSERDADRALVALAEARARAERSRLLRVREIPDFPETGSIPVGDESGSVVPEALNPRSAGCEPGQTSHGGAINSGRTLRERIVSYTAIARRRLGADQVAVCDRDGLLLHRHPGDGDDGGLAAALLLEVSGVADRLLGLGDSRAIQVFTGGGKWRCLIRGGEGEADLFAAFLLGRPLELEEIEAWTHGLAAAFDPPPSPRWKAFANDPGVDSASAAEP